jgi:Na+/H+ antiporter NhaD/arsenite permease-like protein
VALIGAILIMLTEKEKISKYLALIDWKLIFFLMAVFLMIACLTLSGMIEMLNDWIVNSLTTNIFVAIIVILIISALISNFAAKSLSIMIFKATFDMLFLDAFVSEGAHTILLGALIIGVNLGGIIFPQASSHIMKTLSLASENNLKDINYNQMIKMSSIFAIIALITGFIYLSLYYLLFFQ